MFATILLNQTIDRSPLNLRQYPPPKQAKPSWHIKREICKVSKVWGPAIMGVCSAARHDLITWSYMEGKTGGKTRTPNQQTKQSTTNDWQTDMLWKWQLVTLTSPQTGKSQETYYFEVFLFLSLTIKTQCNTSIWHQQQKKQLELHWTDDVDNIYVWLYDSLWHLASGYSYWS